MSLILNFSNNSAITTAVIPFSPSKTPSATSENFIKENNFASKSGILEGRFINAISGTFGIESTKLEPLKQFLSAWSQDESVSQSTLKESGYLWRMFSEESFEEWLEYQNELGRVTSLFSNLFDHPHATKKLIKQLNPKLIEAAIEQATHWQKNPSTNQPSSSCVKSLIVGGSVSLATQNPIPAALSTLDCLQSVVAQRNQQNQGAAQKNADHKKDLLNSMKQQRVSAGADPSYTAHTGVADSINPINFSDQAIKVELYQEVAGRMPKSLNLFLQESKSWVDHVIHGIEFVLDVMHVTAPVNDLKESLNTLENEYWIYVVLPEYNQIFEEPKMAWNRQGRRQDSYEINQMRNKLSGLGYQAQQHATPLRFIRQLKNSGYCELTYSECHP